MSKAKFAAAKELIDEKKYDEARAILKTIDHPTAREWEAKLNRIAPLQPANFLASPTPAPTVYDQMPERGRFDRVDRAEPKVRMQRIWRTIWGVLTLLSIGWMCYGLVASSNAYSQVAGQSSSEAYKSGAAIGATAGIGIFLCTGIPFFLLFVILYWRNGVAISRAKEHAEMLNAVQSRY